MLGWLYNSRSAKSEAGTYLAKNVDIVQSKASIAAHPVNAGFWGGNWRDANFLNDGGNGACRGGAEHGS